MTARLKVLTHAFECFRCGLRLTRRRQAGELLLFARGGVGDECLHVGAVVGCRCRRTGQEIQNEVP